MNHFTQTGIRAALVAALLAAHAPAALAGQGPSVIIDQHEQNFDPSQPAEHPENTSEEHFDSISEIVDQYQPEGDNSDVAFDAADFEAISGDADSISSDLAEYGSPTINPEPDSTPSSGYDSSTHGGAQVGPHLPGPTYGGTGHEAGAYDDIIPTEEDEVGAAGAGTGGLDVIQEVTDEDSAEETDLEMPELVDCQVALITPCPDPSSDSFTADTTTLARTYSWAGNATGIRAITVGGIEASFVADDNSFTVFAPNAARRVGDHPLVISYVDEAGVEHTETRTFTYQTFHHYNDVPRGNETNARFIEQTVSADTPFTYQVTQTDPREEPVAIAVHTHRNDHHTVPDADAFTIHQIPADGIFRYDGIEAGDRITMSILTYNGHQIVMGRSVRFSTPTEYEAVDMGTFEDASTESLLDSLRAEGINPEDFDGLPRVSADSTATRVNLLWPDALPAPTHVIFGDAALEVSEEMDAAGVRVMSFTRPNRSTEGSVHANPTFRFTYPHTREVADIASTVVVAYMTERDQLEALQQTGINPGDYEGQLNLANTSTATTRVRITWPNSLPVPTHAVFGERTYAITNNGPDTQGRVVLAFSRPIVAADGERRGNPAFRFNHPDGGVVDINSTFRVPFRPLTIPHVSIHIARSGQIVDYPPTPRTTTCGNTGMGGGANHRQARNLSANEGGSLEGECLVAFHSAGSGHDLVSSVLVGGQEAAIFAEGRSDEGFFFEAPLADQRTDETHPVTFVYQVEDTTFEMVDVGSVTYPNLDAEPTVDDTLVEATDSQLRVTLRGSALDRLTEIYTKLTIAGEPVVPDVIEQSFSHLVFTVPNNEDLAGLDAHLMGEWEDGEFIYQAQISSVTWTNNTEQSDGAEAAQPEEVTDDASDTSSIWDVNWDDYFMQTDLSSKQHESFAAVESMTPGAGPATGGTPVSITGDRLANVKDVVVAGKSVPFSLLSDGSITFHAPASNKKFVAVYLHGPSDTDVVFAGQFLYDQSAAPQSVGMNTTSGPREGGTEVRIVGPGMGLVTGVRVGSNAANITYTSEKMITFETPSNLYATRGLDVVLEHAGGSVKAGTFTYSGTPSTRQPRPQGMSTLSGSVHGGEQVTITGDDMTLVDEVVFGNSTARIDSKTDTEITVTVPERTGDAQEVAVSIYWNVDSEAVNVARVGLYTYGVLTVDVTSSAGFAGPPRGGNNPIVHGVNLHTIDSVRVDGAPVPITRQDRGVLSFTAPAHDAGVALVEFLTADGSVVWSTPYYYETLNLAAVDSWVDNGDGTVTIIGTRMSKVAVKFAGRSAHVIDKSGTSITVAIPNYYSTTTPDTVPINVIFEGQVISVGDFTYTPITEASETLTVTCDTKVKTQKGLKRRYICSDAEVKGAATTQIHNKYGDDVTIAYGSVRSQETFFQRKSRTATVTATITRPGATALPSTARP